jgi:hypothetical protein
MIGEKSSSSTSKSVTASSADIFSNFAARRAARAYERGFRTEIVSGDQSLKLACLGVELFLSSVYSDAGL